MIDYLGGAYPLLYGALIIIIIHTYQQFVFLRYGHWYFDVLQRLIDTVDVLIHGKEDYLVWKTTQVVVSEELNMEEKKFHVEISPNIPPLEQSHLIKEYAKGKLGEYLLENVNPRIVQDLTRRKAYLEIRFLVMSKHANEKMFPLIGRDLEFNIDNLSKFCRPSSHPERL